jgi:aspartyl-tRNA(Asn)/glutamyl-tRNA(Gln) amidotransferase subunit C
MAFLAPHFIFLPMSLTSQDIDRIANLARLELQPDEAERMRAQINGFLGMVEAMQAVDTTGIVPMAHPVAAIQDITLRLRPDVASEPHQRDLNQRSAPAVERGLFLVPKVIE